MKATAIVISCEHAVNTVPKTYQNLFQPYRDMLHTHRGIDFGALEIAEFLHEHFKSDLFIAEATRLLIDCNRSLHDPNCFSEITKPLSHKEKQAIITTYYTPFRQEVMQRIQSLILAGITLLHLSIHSFTPILNNIERQADIGLLYDPKRITEKAFAKRWQQAMQHITPELRVRLNYPYKGTSDGFTVALRKHFPPDQYIGIELESNQKIVENTQSLRKLKNFIADSLYQTLI